MRETFAVGRLDGTSREVLWLRRLRKPAFPGPWRVRAVVGPARPHSRGRARAAEPEEDYRDPVGSPEGSPAPEQSDGTSGPDDSPSRPSTEVPPARPQLDLFA